MMTSIHTLWQMKQNLRLPRQTLDHLRNDLLQRQVTTAYKNAPFYRKLFDEAKVSPQDIKSANDLEKLPIITKNDIRQNQKGILNVEYENARCYKSHTSGSTGEPTWTYFDRRCWYGKKYFSKMRARMVCGMRWGQKVVIMESETTRKLRLKNRKLSKLFFLLPVKYLSIFEEPDILLDKLIQIKPHNVYGPPSCLFVLAKRAVQAGVTVPNLARLFTSSEYLPYSIKRYIEKTLGAKVYDIYGSTETKEMAWQCAMGEGYHINEDEVIIEIVDDVGNVLPPDHPGNIVITDLCNQAMPLIRYRNYDKGFLLNKTCSCGLEFALMKPLTGRASEYIRLPNGRSISPFLFTTAIEKTKGLLQYQIIQEEIDVVRVKTIFEEGLFNQGSALIRSILSDVTKNMMTIELENCDKINLEKNGKLMVVKNEIDDKTISLP